MARSKTLISLLLGFALLAAMSCAFAEVGGTLARVPGDPSVAKPLPMGTQLNPIFKAAAKKYNVPLDLLLTLGWFGSNFENRGDAPTIEGGYGIMALRDNILGSDTLVLGASLIGESAETVKTDPKANINAAAAVLSSFANAAGINRDGGIDAWLHPVISYAGLDEENSRLFAMEVFQKLNSGLDAVNSEGEGFGFSSQSIGSVNLKSLEPGSALASAESAQYGPAVWDAAATCNYTATSTSKDTVIIHTIEGTAAGARSWFKNCASQVSSHYVVSEAGGVWQCVDEWYRAWHVGCLNPRSVGIENEGYAGSPSHPQSLYDACGLLTRDICNSWGIPKEHRGCAPGILGHNDANACHCGGTHWDPGGGWDWGYFIGVVAGAPPPPSYAAHYVGQSYPASMVAGSTAIAWAEYMNDGTATWSHAGTRLGTQGPQDRCSPFFENGNWLSCSRPSDVDQSAVSTGQVGRFTFILRAPMTPGNYTEQYRPLQESVTWFGGDVTWWITVTGGADTTPPSVPTGLIAVAQSTSQINLAWNASTDNVGVTGYKIYRNGGYLTSVSGLSYPDAGLAEGTTYSYTVSAYDAANNESAQCGAVNESTVIIVDNAETGFTASANWSTGTSAPDKYGANYRFRPTAATSDQATWNCTIPTADNYEVYAWWTAGTNRSLTAAYTVYYNGGSQIVTRNQQTGGGTWNSLGTWNFAAVSTNVKLSCWTTTGKVVVADAVMLIRR